MWEKGVVAKKGLQPGTLNENSPQGGNSGSYALNSQFVGKFPCRPMRDDTSSLPSRGHGRAGRQEWKDGEFEM